MNLDEKGISRILKLCRTLGVSSFRLGDLAFSFSADIHADTMHTPSRRDKPVERKNAEKETLSLLEQTIRENQIDNLLIEDPEQYERLQLQGELVDGETEDDRGAEPALQ